MLDFLNWKLTNRMHNLGYDGKTLMYIDDEEDIINDDSAELIGAKPAILTSAAFRWFREKYNLEITTNIIVSKSFSTLPINKTYSFVVVKTDEVSTERINKSVGMGMDIATPEELNIQALDKLIEIAKKINIGLRI